MKGVGTASSPVVGGSEVEQPGTRSSRPCPLRFMNLGLLWPWARRRKGDSGKVRLPSELQAQTPMLLTSIAQVLKTGSRGPVRSCSATGSTSCPLTPSSRRKGSCILPVDKSSAVSTIRGQMAPKLRRQYPERHSVLGLVRNQHPS